MPSTLPPPIYNTNKSYLDNLRDGPEFSAPLPKREWPPEEQWIDFLGHKIASPIGVPAGPLLDAQWVDLAGKLGFDVVTYKTIRNYEHPSHPLPNVIPVNTGGPLDPKNLPDHVTVTDSFSNFFEDHCGITNSFGNPSRPPEFLAQDLVKAEQSLQKGQLMIVSVFGTEREEWDVVEDFCRTAAFAKEHGAQVVEANFSCPNLTSSGGNLYSDPDAVSRFSKALVHTLRDIPLIIKIGAIPSKPLMEQVFLAAARAGVRGICGINTISMRVLNQKGEAALGAHRERCGVCGNPIREAALTFTEEARHIIDAKKLELSLLATGGVTKPEHFSQFLDRGADIVMSAAGMMWDPFLAAKYHQAKKKETSHV